MMHNTLCGVHLLLSRQDYSCTYRQGCRDETRKFLSQSHNFVIPTSLLSSATAQNAQSQKKERTLGAASLRTHLAPESTSGRVRVAV